MRVALLLAGLAVAGCGPTPATVPKPDPVPWTPAMQAVADGGNRFAFDLYAQLRAEPGNLFLSPFSIHTALAMTADGANGDTRTEMVKVLHLPADAEAWLAAGDMARHYAADGHGCQLAVFNRLWRRQGLPWEPDFLDRLRTRYHAPLTRVHRNEPAQRDEFRWVINGAIDQQQEKDSIKGLVNPTDRGFPVRPVAANTLYDVQEGFDDLGGLLKSRLALSSTAYFNGRWADTSRTQDAPFTRADGSKANLPLTTRTGDYRSLETETIRLVEIPYEGNGAAMVVLLPGTHDGLPALERELTATKVEGWVNAMKSHRLTVSVPRFSAMSRFHLADTLAAMGMPTAFREGGADFSGMTGNRSLSVARVVHQSLIEVAEEGMEAATAVAMAESAPPQFRADHPFLYLIRDTKTGTVLFMGRYAGP